MTPFSVPRSASNPTIQVPSFFQMAQSPFSHHGKSFASGSSSLTYVAKYSWRCDKPSFNPVSERVTSEEHAVKYCNRTIFCTVYLFFFKITGSYTYQEIMGQNYISLHRIEEAMVACLAGIQLWSHICNYFWKSFAK